MYENHIHRPESPETPDPGPTASSNPTGETLPDDVHHAFDRLEALLKKIHDALDARAREEEHRDWSYLRTAGVILEIIVGGLVVLALYDWILYGPVNTLVVKLAFAMVLQLAALTAFFVSGRKE